MPNYYSVKASTTLAGIPVSAALSYVVCEDETPTHYTSPPPKGVPWENVGYRGCDVSISDARAVRTSLDCEGFELWLAPTSVQDFNNRQLIEAVYYNEMCEVVRRATGGQEVHVFDHLIRERESGKAPLDFGRRSGKNGVAPANGRIHNDYTERSGLARIKAVLESKGISEEKRRYSIVNVWRSIGEPVIDTPLALCDSRTVLASDLVEGRVVYPNREGWIYVLDYSPSHRWSYFSDMRNEEVILFKQFDTKLSGVARFTPHTAFEYPLELDRQRPRRSIEMRCLVIY